MPDEAQNIPQSIESTMDLGAPEPPKSQACPWLFIAFGGDRPRYIRIAEKPVSIGRGAEADVVLRDEGVSKVHCTVRLTGQGAVEVADQGSRNGTYVDGRRTEKAVLAPGAELLIGKTVLRMELRDPAQVRFEEDIFRAAVTDALTAVPNRRSFLERAAAEVARSRPPGPAAVFVDVDHFKRVNDTYGHAAGDTVLKEVARRLDATRRGQDFLCRYGGEEFVLLLSGVDLDQAAGFGERVRAGIADRPIDLGGRELPVTASVGVAAFKAGDTLETLLQRADTAMYRAKEGGRNRVERGA